MQCKVHILAPRYSENPIGWSFKIYKVLEWYKIIILVFDAKNTTFCLHDSLCSYTLKWWHSTLRLFEIKLHSRMGANANYYAENVKHLDQAFRKTQSWTLGIWFCFIFCHELRTKRSGLGFPERLFSLFINF